MPKKLSVNTKSEEARARRAAVAADAARKEAEKLEDEKWRDDDKHVNAKLSRRNESQQKAEEKASRRAEIRKLAQEEEVALSSRGKAANAAPAKLTRAEITRRALRSAQEKNGAQDDNDKAPNGSELPPLARAPTIQDEPLAENPNRALLRQMREEGIDSVVISSNLEDAVASLSLSDDVAADRHPEKRMKAAMKAYEEDHLPQLKAEYPTLKRSQLLDMLWKQWKKAPENPMNQQPSR